MAHYFRLTTLFFSPIAGVRNTRAFYRTAHTHTLAHSAGKLWDTLCATLHTHDVTRCPKPDRLVNPLNFSTRCHYGNSACSRPVVGFSFLLTSGVHWQTQRTFSHLHNGLLRRSIRSCKCTQLPLPIATPPRCYASLLTVPGFPCSCVGFGVTHSQPSLPLLIHPSMQHDLHYHFCAPNSSNHSRNK